MLNTTISLLEHLDVPCGLYMTDAKLHNHKFRAHRLLFYSSQYSDICGMTLDRKIKARPN